MSSLNQFVEQSNNITLSQSRDDIIKQIKSAPILMRYLPSIDAFAEYQYKGRIDKKKSICNLLKGISDDTLFSFVEIRGNGACLYNSILVGLIIQNKGVSVMHLLTDLEPHNEISLLNEYNQQIINFMETNYWQINSALEPFGQQYLSKQFDIPLTELTDIKLYGFSKSLSESIQNFQQLGNLLANLFNIVIVLFEGQINASTLDNVTCICITPEQIIDKNIVKNNIQSGIWQVIYLINTSTHYNLVLPHTTDYNLIITEANVFFDKIIDKIRFA